MKKNKNTELIKDDELLRENGMEDGICIISGIELRPITVRSVSWMQRNDIFSENMDLCWRTSAFGYLHSAPINEIRGVVNDREQFAQAVDDWQDANFKHHNELNPISDYMTRAFQLYSSVTTISKGSSSGN